jgi:hypothetical protein
MRREDFVHLYPALKRRAKFIRRYASKTLHQRFLKFVVLHPCPFPSKNFAIAGHMCSAHNS